VFILLMFSKEISFSNAQLNSIYNKLKKNDLLLIIIIQKQSLAYRSGVMLLYVFIGIFWWEYFRRKFTLLQR